MNSRDLHRAVVRATGEAVREIALRGFVLLTCGPVEHEPPDDAEEASEYGFGTGEPQGEPALAF
jgi:hypothetical protein